jgi:hypothetical protein
MGKLGLLASIKESFNDDENEHKIHDNFPQSLSNSFDSSEEDDSGKNLKRTSTQFDTNKYLKMELENLLKVKI